MDYKYIEQLLESYWACTATEQEERILRTFFQQDQLPPHLHRYRSLFAAEEQMASTRLSDDFERRLLAQIGSEATPCRARRISLSHRLRPFFHAAGMLAIILAVGMAAQRTFEAQDERAEERFSEETAVPLDDAAVLQPSQQQAAAQSSASAMDTLTTAGHDHDAESKQ